MNGSILLALAVLSLPAAPATAERLLVHCPPGWRGELAPWAAHRRAQGVAVEFVGEPGEAPPPAAEPTALLIVGDGSTVGLPPVPMPAVIVRRYGPEPTIPTDAPHALPYGADTVARLPFAKRSDLRRYLRRVVQRELGPEPGGAKRLRIAAGVAGFSPMIDAAIEATARRLVTDLAPADAQITLTRYGPAEPRAAPSAGEPGGLWVWLGHGLRDRLPGMTARDLIEATYGVDVCLLLACYAGDFAAGGVSVAERLLASREGPVAVIAASRVSMPYGNARFGAELLLAMRAGRDRPVGELVRVAKRRLVADRADERLAPLDGIATLLGAAEEELPIERAEHAAMYHLLGDPMVRLERPPLRVAALPGER